jgi:hypothetical protein
MNIWKVLEALANLALPEEFFWDIMPCSTLKVG